MSISTLRRKLLQALKRSELSAQTAIQQLDLGEYSQLRESLFMIRESNAKCEDLLRALEELGDDDAT